MRRLPIHRRSSGAIRPMPFVASMFFVLCAGLVLGFGAASAAGAAGAAGAAPQGNEGTRPAETSASPSPARTKMGPRTAIKKAREALDFKQLPEARHFYEIAQANSRKGSKRHAEALLGAGLLRLHLNPRLPDGEGETLADLDDRRYNNGDLRVAAFGAKDAQTAREEIQRLHDSLTSLDQSSRTEKDELTKERDDAQAELKKCQEDSTNQAAAIAQLERDKAAQKGELESLSTELAEKNETIMTKERTIDRMKRALVKQKPPIKTEPSK